MVFILFEDGFDTNIVKIMVGSMIRGDFYWKYKRNIGMCQNRHKKYVSWIYL
jgi:hypothetical protein